MKSFNLCLAFALTLLLLPGSLSAAIRGIVVSTDGAAIQGATLSAFAPEGTSERIVRFMARRQRTPLSTAASDDQGSFSLDVSSPAYVIVGISAPQLSSSSQLMAATTSGHTFVLQPARKKQGRVTFSGKPVSDVTVILFDEIGESWAKTTAEGTFEFQEAAQGSQVLLLHPDFAPGREFVGGSDSAGTINLQISKGRVIRGSVVHGEKPVAGAQIFVDELPAARSDEKGTFTVARAPERVQVLRAVGGPGAGSLKNPIGSMQIKLADARTISGSVRDDRGPLPNAVVYAQDQEQRIRVISDAKGAFSFSGLSPGRYWVSAEVPGYSVQMDTEVAVVDLRKTRTGEVKLIARRDEKIAGFVRDHEGKPLAAALVTFYPARYPLIYGVADDENEDQSGTYSSADGSFSLPIPELGEEMGTTELVLIAYRKGLPIGKSKSFLPEKVKSLPVLTITVPQGVELSGRVTDPSGKPVADAAVAVIQRDDDSGMIFPIEQLVSRTDISKTWPTTDAQGQFRLRLNPGLHDLSVLAKGFAPGTINSLRVDRESPSLQMKLVRGLELTGRLIDSENHPVEGADAMLEGETATVSGNTDKNGQFVFGGLTAGSYEISFAKDGQILDKPRAVDVPGESLEVKLAPKTQIRGLVLSKADGVPIHSFSVGTETDSSHDMNQPMETFDSPDGTFVLTNVPSSGELKIIVESPGYVASITELTTGESGKRPEVRVEMEKGLTLRGRVRGGDGDAVAGVSVSLDASWWYHQDEEIVTDDNGAFVIESMRPGELSLEFTREGFARARRKILLTEQSEPLEITLLRGKELVGLVVDESGSPVQEADVYASSTRGERSYDSARTDMQGKFTLDGLAEGRYKLNASKTGFERVEIEEVDTDRAQTLRLVLKKAGLGMISGVVRGLSPSDTMRMVSAESEDSSETAPVDSAGKYRIERAPIGDVTVSLRIVGASGMKSKSKKTAVVAGSEVRVDFDLDSESSVGGSVTENGKPVPNAQIAFSSDNDSMSGTTSGDGTYEIKGLADGKYNVSVETRSSSDGYQTEYEVRGSGVFDIAIKRTVVSGRVIDSAAGKPLSAVDVTVVPVSPSSQGHHDESIVKTNAEGKFSTTITKEGLLRIRASKEGYGQHFVELPTGSKTTGLTLELRPSDGIAVRLVDAPSGRALDGIIVVRDQQNRYAFNGSVEAKSDGSIRLPLSRGSYQLSASSSGYATRSTPIVVPSGEVKLALTPGGSLIVNSTLGAQRSAKLVHPSGEEYIRCECNGIAEIKIEGRTTKIDNIAPGHYAFQLISKDGSQKTHSVDILEGSVTTLEID